MTYITGTIDNASPGAALYEVVATALTSAGYELVDTVVISTRTHKVWKSPAGINSAGKDWFIDIAYPTSGGTTLHFLPMEFYDPATDLAYRTVYGGVGSSTTIDAATGTRWGSAGHTLESGNIPLGPHNGSMNRLPLSATAFGYWISITGDRIVGFTSIEPTTMTYFGLYSASAEYASLAGAGLFPLIFARYSTFGTGSASNSPATANLGINRIYPATQVSWNEFGMFSPYWAPNIGITTPRLALPGVPAAGSTQLTNGQRLASLIGVYSTLHNGMTTPVAHLGSLIGAAVVGAGVTVNRGDTVTIGSDTWILTSAGGSSAGEVSAALFKAA